MPLARNTKPLERRDDRIIIHFDYDCFYASVIEAENPSLKSQPLAVQQKQIIVTCNYEARRRGLRKLQLITEAKKVCPDVIIVLGEDLTRFRDASKDLYNFLRAFSWNSKVERLGFDEVWLDVTDIVEYNLSLLNRHSLSTSFFQISQSDPTLGFAFDASKLTGHAYPPTATLGNASLDSRLLIGSHLALYMRHQLEEHKGYTSTVGISTCKLLSKLVGNLNKPKGQTTLLPPYESLPDGSSHVHQFLDPLDVGNVPWIGFKLSQQLRQHALGRPAEIDRGLIYGGTHESVTVGALRTLPSLTPASLETLLAGPGAPHGIGARVHALLNGVDDAPVALARAVPRQISIEDSYVRLDTFPELRRQLASLASRLIIRMRVDLTESVDDKSRRWLAKPSTLRLTTRPRAPTAPDGTRVRSFKRISRSAPMPGFVFVLTDSPDALAERLLVDALLPLFRRLHPEKSGWNLSLVNVGATDVVEAASETSHAAAGRDIGNMFRNQDTVLSEFRVTDDVEIEDEESLGAVERGDGAQDGAVGDEDVEDGNDEPEWQADDDSDEGQASSQNYFICPSCGQSMPLFAQAAHARFHTTAGSQ